jgi:hypothetical protein
VAVEMSNDRKREEVAPEASADASPSGAQAS